MNTNASEFVPQSWSNIKRKVPRNKETLSSPRTPITPLPTFTPPAIIRQPLLFTPTPAPTLVPTLAPTPPPVLPPVRNQILTDTELLNYVLANETEERQNKRILRKKAYDELHDSRHANSAYLNTPGNVIENINDIANNFQGFWLYKPTERENILFLMVKNDIIWEEHLKLAQAKLYMQSWINQ